MMRITSTSDPLQILLVEDSKGDAILIEKAIDRAMPEIHLVKKAQNLSEALEILTHNTFDIALLDRSLPDAEGFEGLYSIQNMAPELPVVFLTAYKDEQTALDSIKKGAQDYLFKDKIDGHVIKRAIQYAVLRKQFEGILIARANFDMLTGLANRMLFESRLEMALAKIERHGGSIAVLFLDLDRFKQVNDTYGHRVGDMLLKEVGKRLKNSLRPYDTAARFGGDEFAILLEDLPKTEHCERVAQKTIELFSTPFEISEQIADIGVSIGIATCTSGQKITMEKLIEQADTAMYKAKPVSGNGYRIYADDMDDAPQKRQVS